MLATKHIQTLQLMNETVIAMIKCLIVRISSKHCKLNNSNGNQKINQTTTIKFLNNNHKLRKQTKRIQIITTTDKLCVIDLLVVTVTGSSSLCAI